MENDTKIIEFPFRMNWMAANSGGRKLLEIYWETVAGLNEIAASGYQMLESDWAMVADLNKMFEPWGLPTFPTKPMKSSSLAASMVLPFPIR